MVENKPNKNKNVTLIGVILILLVSLATVVNFFLNAKKSSESNENASLENQPASSAKSITSKELSGKIGKDKSLIIVDLRDPDSFKREHILNSKNVLLTDLEKAASGWDKNKNYVLVGYQDLGQVSQMASQALEGLGFEGVNYLDEGFEGWKAGFNPTISEGDPTSFADQAKVNYISSDELEKSVKEGENLYIIDLRQSENFNAGHLKGAVNIFLDDLENKYREIPSGKKIILCDKDGLWAFQGAVRLFDLGLFNVFSLSDGLDSWKQKGFEIVR